METLNLWMSALAWNVVLFGAGFLAVWTVALIENKKGKK